MFMMGVFALLLVMIYEVVQSRFTIQNVKAAILKRLRANEKEAGIHGSDYRAANRYYKQGLMDVARELDLQIKAEEYK